MNNVVYIARGGGINQSDAQRSFVDAVLRRAHFLSLATVAPSACEHALKASQTAAAPVARDNIAPSSLTGRAAAVIPFNGGQTHDT